MAARGWPERSAISETVDRLWSNSRTDEDVSVHKCELPSALSESILNTHSVPDDSCIGISDVRDNKCELNQNSSLYLGGFVKSEFVPGYVLKKRASGRAHFH